MKKLFVSVLAIAALVACNNEQTLVQKGNAPMEFGASFVENATRAIDPSTTTGSLTGFDVWAFMDQPSGQVFVDEDVTKSGDAWSYQNAQYWTPGHVYYFAALAPMNSTNWDLDTANADVTGAGKISFTNVDGTEDLLYAATSVSTMDLAVGAVPADAPVKFQFNHMLSKVKFSFTNGFDNNNAFITVSNIRMEVPAQGTIDVAQADWWSTNKWELGEGTTILDFGDMETEKVAYNGNTESQYERLTIPAGANQKYTVTFDVALFMGTVEAYNATLTTVIEGAELKIGKAYNFKAELNAENIVPGEGENDTLKKIEFAVEEVKTWENGNGYDGEDIETGFVAPYEQAAPIAANEVVTLTSDVASADSIDINGGTFDGGNFAVYAAVENMLKDNGMFRPTSGTIKNVTVNGGNKSWNDNGTLRGLRGVYSNGTGDIVLENVSILSCAYAINGNNAGMLTVNNSTLQGWTSYGQTTTGEFTDVNFILGNFYATNVHSSNDNGLFRPYNNAVLTNCAFEDGFVICFKELTDGESIKFVNCTYNGVVITAENFATLVKYDGQFAGKIAF